MDEKSFLRGHDYVTVLKDISRSRVLDTERDRAKEIKTVTSDICNDCLNYSIDFN